MTQDSIIKIAIEILNDKPEIHISKFGKLMDILLCLFTDRIEKGKTKHKNERLYYVNLLTQKFIVHSFSIKKLINGITLESPSKNFSIEMLDPFSIHTLVRTIVENYLVQNYLTNTNLNDDTLQLRFEIWMRYGLMQRNIEPESDEAKRVSELDKKSIGNLENSIKTRKGYLELSESKKVSFHKTIDKEWKIIFDKEKFYPVSWKRLIKEAGIKDGINDQIYNFLSWHAHSQSISVLQLKNMWDENNAEETVQISIKKLNMFVGFIISDIIKSDIEFRNSYNNLSAEYKDLINFYNMSYRGTDYMIEQTKN
jgi:hypothetical protein